MPNCTVCDRLYLYKTGLISHMKLDNQNQPASTYGQCGKMFNRKDNLLKHLRLCIGRRPPPPQQQPQHQQHQQHIQLHHHQRSPSIINTHQWEVLWPVTASICRRHSISTTYHQLSTPPPSTNEDLSRKNTVPTSSRFSITIVCHKVVDPNVVTQPPVTLNSEIIAVYAAVAAPPLDDVNRELQKNFIEVFELKGSGWVFSHFQDLQLTLWQLDPLRGSAHIPTTSVDPDKESCRQCRWHR